MASVFGVSFARALDAVRSVGGGGARKDTTASETASKPSTPDAITNEAIAPAPATATTTTAGATKAAMSSGIGGDASRGRGMIGKKSLPLRHRKMRIHDTGSGKFKRDLRRVARRAGVKRFGGGVDEEAHSALRAFMTTVRYICTCTPKAATHTNTNC